MKSFRVEVRCSFPEWDRYAVYMTAVCFGTDGEMLDYVNLTGAAENILETPLCDHADLYLYVIAREFPASDVIAASPPFEIEVVTTSSDSATPGTSGTSDSATPVTPSGTPGTSKKSTPYEVNQWGGLSIKQNLV